MNPLHVRWPIALSVTGALAVGGGGVNWYMSSRDATVSSASRPTASSRVAVPVSPVADLRLGQLHRERGDLAHSDRDLFRFKQAPPPPRPPAPPPAMGPPAPPPPVVASGPPPPPPIQLKFIGLVETPAQGGRLAVLSDAKGNVFYGKEGDIIDGRYRVLKIGVESAELAYVDGRGRQTIRLSGQ